MVASTGVESGRTIRVNDYPMMIVGVSAEGFAGLDPAQSPQIRVPILMMATMLHSIATGNMIPAAARTICVDINPAVVTKLSDRGSGQTIGIVTDVGLFLRSLADTL